MSNDCIAFYKDEPIASPKRKTGDIRVGLTEKHGMAVELSKYPPTGVHYSFINCLPVSNSFVRSPIKGYLGHYTSERHELIEAIMSPIVTNNKWIYSLAKFHEAIAFNFMGIPLPKTARIACLKYLILKHNCKKIVFWSNAGLATLHTYGKVTSGRILKNSTVVYPAVREVPDDLIHYNGKDEINILFSGNFFIKGGINVIDAFERAQRIYPQIKLILCCDMKIDFNSANEHIKSEYIQRIQNNKAILWMGRIPRHELIQNVLPKTDIYLLPTYVEAFGYALLEAMAYGIPVIATNYFAIPEIVEHNRSGFLIDTSQYDCDKLFKGYVIDPVPNDFRKHVTDCLFEYLCKLIESPVLREKLGRAGLDIARTKFSFCERNEKMYRIYQEALADA